MTGKLDDYLRFNQATLAVRAQRQQVLASNMANADTPNYKARDLDFSKALQGALAQNGAAPPPPLNRTSVRHLDGKAPQGVDENMLLYRKTLQGAIDGNTVDMDVERNQFADNAIRYEAGLTQISAQIKAMLAAIQG